MKPVHLTLTAALFCSACVSGPLTETVGASRDELSDVRNKVMQRCNLTLALTDLASVFVPGAGAANRFVDEVCGSIEAQIDDLDAQLAAVEAAAAEERRERAELFARLSEICEGVALDDWASLSDECQLFLEMQNSAPPPPGPAGVPATVSIGGKELTGRYTG